VPEVFFVFSCDVFRMKVLCDATRRNLSQGGVC
jgi:hypothetical protein